jgi:hypothetical protein
VGRYLDIADEALRSLGPCEGEKSEVSEERPVDRWAGPCTECGSRTWTVALDGVCYDCVVGLTQLRRGGAAV